MDPILAALQQAPRRYRLPPLPPDWQAAAAAGPATAVAFAIETARLARLQDRPVRDEVRDLFTDCLAQLIREALDPASGDAAFQALVLRGQEEVIDEYVRLAARASADRRVVRSALDGVAHPGKLRQLPTGAARDGLGALHLLAREERWQALAEALRAPPGPQALDAVRSGEPLQRLVRAEQLAQHEAVRRYRALCERRGLVAGSGDAAAQGRAAARVGDAAEQATLAVFRQLAALLDRHEGSPGRYRAIGSLRTPPGYPGEPGKAKDEWDAAVLRSCGDSAAIALLAEVKASPPAATPDYARLLRGLLRLAHAAGDEAYQFSSATGPVRIGGESLRELRPRGLTLPPHVIYCCAAPPEARPALLTAASQALLLGQPASLAFAQRLAHGESPPPRALQPVWQQLAGAPHLRPTLHQYETAQAAREAIVRPDDLLAALHQITGNAASRPGNAGTLH